MFEKEMEIDNERIKVYLWYVIHFSLPFPRCDSASCTYIHSRSLSYAACSLGTPIYLVCTQCCNNIETAPVCSYTFIVKG